MCTSLALISGKGGSGKTTIGLSIAEMLASCNKRVLFVDCDMSTHGATYFFEPFINEKSNILTTLDVFFNYYTNNDKSIKVEKTVLNVAKNIDFIPSCVDFSEVFFEDVFLQFSINEYNQLKKEYDLVIFDCQAGYSLVTDRVLDVTDYNLVVMEEDAISSSAVRVLHSQLSRQLNNAKTYQVFNKLSDEDYQLYKKITNGTFYTNLTPVMFDWSVKRAFIAHDLPEINEDNPILTENIYKLTCEIFPMFKRDLEKYIIKVKEKLIVGIRRDIEENKRKRKNTYIQRFFPLSFTFIMCTVLMIISFMFYLDEERQEFIYIIFATIGALATLLFAELSSNRKEKKEITEKYEYKSLTNELETLQRDVKSLKNKYAHRKVTTMVDGEYITTLLNDE